MKKWTDSLTIVCLGLAVMVGLSTLCQAQEVEIDRYLVEVVRDHVNNIVHYRNKLLREPHRPTYHFVTPEGIAEPFDPNGAIYWNGRYHLFYIFQERRPRANYRGDSWGHVSSHDLLSITASVPETVSQPARTRTSMYGRSHRTIPSYPTPKLRWMTVNSNLERS
jgi:hypothetical protein